MSLFIASLNSGSNGNCYYIGNDQDAVLIDAGISCRETERRMARLNLHMAKVKAIFISHEHGDHIRGLTVLAKKYRLPVYITPATLRNSPVQLEPLNTFSFEAFKPVNIGTLFVTSFPKLHDAADPHSFLISGNDTTVGVFTDIGACCSNVIDHFQRCDAVFLETNYDAKMLEEGFYPFHLKKRIRGGHGHLSNHQALQLCQAQRSPSLSHILLSHLSRENNDPFLALELFQDNFPDINISVASRFEESQVFHIKAGNAFTPLPPRSLEALRSSQMTLF
jgi:phosphoribosyl 1,2-cyclic phosphodiesterase